MKPLVCLLTGAGLLLQAGCVVAQSASVEPPVPVVVAVRPLDQLVAPIALYPDPLVALILPAATASSDVVLAARYLKSGGDPQRIDAQAWDDSVKGLAHYPEVVKWMDENLAWTVQLGAAYLNRPAEVMAAVQRVRAEARSKGLLGDTPQQQVVLAGSYIEIVPARPDVIYVPRYDPDYIFIDRPVYYGSDPWLTFGVGFGVGWWLSNDFDWDRRVIWVDRDSREHWREHRDWRHPDFPEHPGSGPPDRNWHPWRPMPGRPPPPHRDFDGDHRTVIRPRPMPGAPRVDGERERGRDEPTRFHDAPAQRPPPPDRRPARPEQPPRPPMVQDRGPVGSPPRDFRPAPDVRSNPNRDGGADRRPGPGDFRPERHDRRPVPATPPNDPAAVRPARQEPPVVQRAEPRMPPRQEAPPARFAPAPAGPRPPGEGPRGSAPGNERRSGPTVSRPPQAVPAARPRPADDPNQARDDRGRREPER